MKIQKRRVNSKRHTVGYKVGGKWVSRSEAVKLASKGKIDGVSVCKYGAHKYIKGRTFRLYDLETQVV